MVSYEELDLAEKEGCAKLGTLIKQRRGKMSVYRLARLSKVSEVTIHRIEAGKGCNWGAASRVCRTLNLTIMIL